MVMLRPQPQRVFRSREETRDGFEGDFVARPLPPGPVPAAQVHRPGGGREDPHHRKGHQLLEAPVRGLGVDHGAHGEGELAGATDDAFVWVSLSVGGVCLEATGAAVSKG